MGFKNILSEQNPTDNARKKLEMAVRGMLGKTMNVYSAQPNTNQNFLKTYRIVSVKPLGTIGTKIILTVDDNESHGRTDLVKTCGKAAFENANAVGGKNRFVYSDKLKDLLEMNFCTRSKGGSVVPSADFAATDTTDDTTTMAEGKKVVRLTESDIKRIVENVLNEEGGTGRRFGKEDEIRRKAFNLATSMHDFDVHLRRGDSSGKKEALQQIKFAFKSLKEMMDEIEKDIKRNSIM